MTSDPSTGPQTLTVQVGGLPGDAVHASRIGFGDLGVPHHRGRRRQDRGLHGVRRRGCLRQRLLRRAYRHLGLLRLARRVQRLVTRRDREGGTWADGPYVYGPAPFDESTGLYEAFLGSCANHGGYQPCFVNISGEGSNTTQVHSPASANDPRISH